jgi:hypothetical protein
MVRAFSQDNIDKTTDIREIKGKVHAKKFSGERLTSCICSFKLRDGSSPVSIPAKGLITPDAPALETEDASSAVASQSMPPRSIGNLIPEM